jgi:hypothetical protein
MLIHHNSMDYEVAASEAAREARSKFQAQIDRGRERALAVINQIESQVPQDRVVPANRLTFQVNGEDIEVTFPDQAQTVEGFHRHAIGQAAARADIPLGYIDKLMAKGQWGKELVAENLNRLYGNMDNKVRMLTRSVNSQVRGVLSDSYRRMDSRPIVDQFIAAMQQFGAVVLDGFALETRIAIQAVLPFVFEPVPNEVMIYGVGLTNSDFGNGALSLRTFVERLFCTNRAISTEELRKIHLGARLGDDLQLSERTYQLDTETMASATADIVTKSLSSGSVNDFMSGIRKANEQKVEPGQVMAFLKRNLSKGEQEKVIDAYNSPDVENLPPGNSRWRLSNAISWVANGLPEDRKLDVMQVAGAALKGSLSNAAPVIDMDAVLV